MQGHTGNHFLLPTPFFPSCSACGSSTPSPTRHRRTFTYSQTQGVPPGVCPCTAGSRRQSTCQEAAASLPDNVQAVAACQRLWCGDSEGDLQDFFTLQGMFHHVAVCTYVCVCHSGVRVSCFTWGATSRRLLLVAPRKRKAYV